MTQIQTCVASYRGSPIKCVEQAGTLVCAFNDVADYIGIDGEKHWRRWHDENPNQQRLRASFTTSTGVRAMNAIAVTDVPRFARSIRIYLTKKPAIVRMHVNYLCADFITRMRRSYAQYRTRVFPPLRTFAIASTMRRFVPTTQKPLAKTPCQPDFSAVMSRQEEMHAELVGLLRELLENTSIVKPINARYPHPDDPGMTEDIAQRFCNMLVNQIVKVDELPHGTIYTQAYERFKVNEKYPCTIDLKAIAAQDTADAAAGKVLHPRSKIRILADHKHALLFYRFMLDEYQKHLGFELAPLRDCKLYEPSWARDERHAGARQPKKRKAPVVLELERKKREEEARRRARMVGDWSH